ncbi:MAG: nucleotidyltransferase domain-containing protein [Gammaproteobacteria bacterium]|nr:nucleotidyltransferase domain-containing protein [Gammaproteobacteria bacterium]
MPNPTSERFHRALDNLVDELKEDRHIVAAILCGSLAYDEVWDKSDIDLHLISTDDKKNIRADIALSYEDVNIHTSVQIRSEFKRMLDASFRNTFGHSMFAHSKLLFSRDPSISSMLEDLQKIGKRDRQLQVLGSASHAVACWYKARKWYEVKDDKEYTALWILQMARALAEVEVSLANELVDREALVRALELNPALYKLIYSDLLLSEVNREKLGVALDAFESWMIDHTRDLFAPLLDYLKSTGGEPQSVTQINHYFSRNYNVRHVILACEWLSDQGIIEKASTPTKLTVHSQNEVEELAFFIF